MPNTIATVLSQTNIFTFSNADAGWYLTLIVASKIIATIAAYIVVKRMGYLPSSVDDIRGKKF